MRTRFGFVGLPGAGKTVVGKQFAEFVDGSWLDLDAEIEKRSKQTIENIFRVEGEEVFRRKETEMLKDSLSSEVSVLSLGGGVLEREENRRLLREHNVQLVWLDASVRQLSERLQSKDTVNRPLLKNAASGKAELQQKLQELRSTRASRYREAGPRVVTDFLADSGVAQSIVEMWRAEGLQIENSSLVPISLLEERSSTLVGGGVLSTLPHWVKTLFPRAKKVALLIDENVAELWGEKIESIFAVVQGLEIVKMLIPAGEQSKNLRVIEELTERALAAELTRTDAVVGVGGGMVGDLAGLWASLFMRGIGLIQVPTSLLAQVDAAIGGKTAVNLLGAENSQGAKNVLGTFYPGRLVMSDVDFLDTLPDREFLSGMAEVVKYGLIDSEDLFASLEENAKRIVNREKNVLRDIVEQSSISKLNYVAQDVTDISGRRALLNFGHTVGHGVESLGGYQRFLHGEAIAIGMCEALRQGCRVGITEPETLERTESLLKKFKLPVSIPTDLLRWGEGSSLAADTREQTVQVWRSVLKADKKRASDGFRFIFVRKPGRSEVGDIELEALLESMLSQ